MQVLLTVPDKIYAHAVVVAEDLNRDVSVILEEMLASGFDDTAIETHSSGGALESEWRFFEDNYRDLYSLYPNKFVALKAHQVIDHDTDVEALEDRLLEQYPNQPVFVRRVTEKQKRVIHVRSPRLVRDPE